MSERTLSRRKVLAGTGAGALAAPMIIGSANAQATINWKMATAWPGGPLMEIGAKAFAERLDLLTEGRFKVQVFPGGALGNALKVPETVKNGVAECGHTWMGYDWGADTTTTLFGGYAGSFDTERMLHWIYEAGGLEMQKKFRDETAGIVSMPLFYPHRRGLPAFAQAGAHPGRHEGPQAAQRRRLARHGARDGSRSGDHSRWRDLHRAGARHHRRH
jgi:TRAP-type mannitol/chloroaromatic compound transport system substrate-binding protein